MTVAPSKYAFALCLALAGCKASGGFTPQKILGVPIEPSLCAQTKVPDVRGWIKVMLPDTLKLGQFDRNVHYNVFDKPKPDIGSPDNSGNDNDGKESYKGKVDPFHIYLKKFIDKNPGTNELVAISLIIPAQSRYLFATIPPLNAYGIAGSQPVNPTPSPTSTGPVLPLICVPSKTPSSLPAINPGPPPATVDRQVVTFYVNTLPASSGSGEIGGYTILLQPTKETGTPIIIDPKVYNDG